jgi:hypothetical protein
MPIVYLPGSILQAQLYNNAANNLNSIWAVGTGSNGYGQPPQSTVAVGQLIRATDGDTIRTVINNASLHQGTTLPSIPFTLPAVGELITYNANISPAIAAILANELNCSATGTDITVSGVRTAPWGGGVSIPTVRSTITMTFASYDKMRYFFNTGGTFRISCSSGAGTGTPQDILWTTLCSGMGTLSMPAVSTTQIIVGTSYAGLKQLGGTIAPTTLVASGFYNLTATPTQLFEQVDGGVYGSDSISIVYNTVGSSVIATILFEDTNNQTIDGTLTVFATARPSETTYIANTWGTPTITVTSPVTL